MIQRIQSIFLLLAAGALGGQFALPYLSVAEADPARSVPALADGVFNLSDNPGLLGLTALGALISVAAIFLYKNRQLQARLAIVAAGVGLMLLVLAGIALYNALNQAPDASSIDFNLGLALPAVAILLNWLAARAIRKDEALVRSMDRLR